MNYDELMQQFRFRLASLQWSAETIGGSSMASRGRLIFFLEKILLAEKNQRDSSEIRLEKS